MATLVSAAVPVGMRPPDARPAADGARRRAVGKPAPVPAGGRPADAPRGAGAAQPAPAAAPRRHLVVCGSPRPAGRSAAAADGLARGIAARDPRARVERWAVAGKRIAGCIGCDACRATGACVFRDDMAGLMDALGAADELHLVSPVYFAGPPAQLKAAFDRLQPHYWKGTRKGPRRPAHLLAVGEGGDPYGFEPLVGICRSALAVAGFDLVSVEACIGKGEAGHAR